MSIVPICANCLVRMKFPADGNNVFSEDGKGGVHAHWRADLFECPECGSKVLGGFSTRDNSPQVKSLYEDVKNSDKTYVFRDD